MRATECARVAFAVGDDARGAVWRHCHSGLIIDALKVCGIEVFHISGPEHSQWHAFTAPARAVDGTFTYVAPSLRQRELDLGAGTIGET